MLLATQRRREQSGRTNSTIRTLKRTSYWLHFDRTLGRHGHNGPHFRTSVVVCNPDEGSNWKHPLPGSLPLQIFLADIFSGVEPARVRIHRASCPRSIRVVWNRPVSLVSECTTPCMDIVPILQIVSGRLIDVIKGDKTRAVCPGRVCPAIDRYICRSATPLHLSIHSHRLGRAGRKNSHHQ